jgi:hypothetical protein
VFINPSARARRYKSDTCSYRCLSVIVRYRMPGHNVSRDIFKNSRGFDDYICPECNLLLNEPVQLSCGDRFCKSCADSVTESHAPPRCPKCEELCDVEDRVYVSNSIYDTLGLVDGFALQRPGDEASAATLYISYTAGLA